MIGLFENAMKEIPLYDVIFGDDNNSAVVLRKRSTMGEKMVEVARADFSIEPMAPLYYWLSHHHGVISCGTGKQPGKNQLLQWQDKTKKNNIKLYGLSSNDSLIEYENIQSTDGVKRSRTKYIVAVRRRGSMLWNTKWQLPLNKTLTLDADAPQADIYLGLRNSSAKKDDYTIRLGEWRNSRCVIMKANAPLLRLIKTSHLDSSTFGLLILMMNKETNASL